MPNHIYNELTILAKNSSNLKKVLKFLRNGGENEIDFNAIIPMHEDLKVESSSTGEIGYAHITGKKINRFESVSRLRQDFKELDQAQKDEALKLGRIYATNAERYGYPTWYSWSPANWGTKWNAYETNVEENVISFETAWAGVPTLIQKLAEMFPNVVFKYEYSDEDTGSNVGKFRFTGNETCETRIDDSSNEAYELAFKHRPYEEKYYHKVDGKWEYNEDAE